MTRLRRGEDGFGRAIVQALRAGLCGEEPSPRVRDALLRGAAERMHAIRDAEGTLARWRQAHPHPRLWREGDLYHAQSVPPDSARLMLETRRVMLALV